MDTKVSSEGSLLAGACVDGVVDVVCAVAMAMIRQPLDEVSLMNFWRF